MKYMIFFLFLSFNTYGQVFSNTNTGQKTIVIPADITLNSTTLVSLGTIVIPANSRYVFEFSLHFSQLNNAADLRMRVNTNASGRSYMDNIENATSRKLDFNLDSVQLPVTTATGNACDRVLLSGWIETNTTDEAVEFFISNHTGVNPQILLADSYLTANKIK